jgi:flagellar hook-basal body complex protein FliE
LDNPATVTIAATKSELAVELLVQLRNKALDAYSELTRISV